MPKQVATTPVRQGLLPTPTLPADAGKIELSENARRVFSRRYMRRGIDGNPIETPEETFWRVAYHVAKAEETWRSDVIKTAHCFYDLLINKKFFPNSPTFTGAGTPLGQLAACFVLPISDDMGRLSTGIFQSLRDAALIQQTGGGNGFSFSRLRPAGTLVKSSAGQATGPIGFLRVYDKAFGEVAQGGTRRGANMAVLRVDHPDIEEFVTCKTDENAITNFNISVGITDAFMQAVENDDWWELRFPDISTPEYSGFDGTIDQAVKAGIPIKIHKRLRARELFDKIVLQAHHNGEPGLLFVDAANRSNPLTHLYELEATNPCGEQWLGPYENCCLGSINLAQFLASENSIDWEKLRQTVVDTTRFLDDVVEVNAYVPAVPQLKEAAHRARRLGLGIMGLADLLYHAGVRYGSVESLDLGAQVMEFVRYHAMSASIELAKERGPFPVIKGSLYDPEHLQWQPPQPLNPYQCDWSRPAIDWEKIREGIKQHGIRNAAQTTVAPTGTIATVAGVEGYGCEPVFALAYTRNVNDNGKNLELSYLSPQFEKALDAANLDAETKQRITERVIEQGSCQHLFELPESIRNVFVVSADINAEEHVYMQAALQAFVDNSLSKTVNFPAGTEPEEIAKAYQLAWRLGCKGITVYVAGSRQKVVLETKATAKDKSSPEINTQDTLAISSEAGQQLSIWPESKKPRPRQLHGLTYHVSTPLGKAFITINENGDSQPFEVFINTAKAGSETAAISEAIGRLLSYILRMASPVLPRERLEETVRQLSGLGGERSLGFGPNKVRSLPDGVAQIIAEYLRDISPQETTAVAPTAGASSSPIFTLEPLQIPTPKPRPAETATEKVAEICPECGQATMINEEGCRKCHSCGFSEC